MKELEFIAKCEELLERDGKTDGALIGAFPRRNALVYRSPGLTVLRGPEKDLEISICYYRAGDGGRRSENPVFCRNTRGELYRTHGEYVYAQTRLQRLLAGERPTEPIHLGEDSQDLD